MYRAPLTDFTRCGLDEMSKIEKGKNREVNGASA